MNKPNVGVISNLSMERPQVYERYIPNAFDDTLSIVEKVNKTINHMNEVSTVTNEVVDQWNKVSEWAMNDGLQTSVNEKVNGLVQDGTIESLINDTALVNINNKVDGVTNSLQQYGTNSYIINPNAGTRYIAHRGLSGIAPEGTIPAFIQASEKGMFSAECDVRLTADGEWVVFHDTVVDRITNGTGAVADLTLAQIKELNVISGSNISLYPNLKIPTLSEFLTVCREYDIIPNIEIKSETYEPTITSAQYDSFVTTIRNSGLESKCIVQGNDFICTAIRERSQAIVLMLFTTVATLPVWSAEYMKRIGNIILNTDATTVNSKYDVDLCHSYGFLMSVFVVDDINKAKALEGYGVDFIMSNRLIGGSK